VPATIGVRDEASPTARAYPLVSTTSTIHLEESAYTKLTREKRRIFGANFNKMYSADTPRGSRMQARANHTTMGKPATEKGEDHVNRFSNMMFLAALAGTAGLYAQSNPFSTEVKANYNNTKTNLMKAAEKVSEADYDFKATPDVRTYGQLVGHVADTQMALCGVAKGEQKRGGAGEMTSKADLVAALKASFDYCDSAYDALNDADGAQTVKMFGRDRTKLGVLDFNVIHDNEMYGTMAVYMRLKGIVPPSTADRPMGQGKGGKK
jgi:DinB family protein